LTKFTRRQWAEAQDQVNRMVEEIKTQRTRDLFYLNCAACMEPMDLADFVETGKARCPECNQLNQTNVNAIQFTIEGLI
jgi:phage FluMu protein Com